MCSGGSFESRCLLPHTRTWNLDVPNPLGRSPRGLISRYVGTSQLRYVSQLPGVETYSDLH